MLASELNHWFRRWARSPESVRRRTGRPSLRYHLGEPNIRASIRADQLLLWAYCGLSIMGDKSAPAVEVAFETCPKNCDEALHCRQCTRSLARRLAGRSA